MAYRLGNRILKIDNKLFYAEGVSPVNPVWSGLTSYWKFDETSGTVAYDAIGSANGTLRNSPAWTTGKNNSGISTAGATNKGIDCGANYKWARTQPYTYSVWLNRADLTSQWQRIICNLFPIAPYQGVFDCFIYTDNKLWIRISFGKGNTLRMSSRISNNTLFTSTGIWYHLVVTWDGNGGGLASGFKIYINGIEFTDTTNTNQTPLTDGTSANNFSIGNETEYSKHAFRGILDEVGLWNRVLSQAEVTALYNSGNGLFY